MYNVSLVRQICGEISRETNQEKTNELLRLLKLVIHDDIADARARMDFIRQKYAPTFQYSAGADTVNIEDK